VALRQVLVDGLPRLARGPAAAGPTELLDARASIDGVLGGDPGALQELLDGPAAGSVPTAFPCSPRSAPSRSGRPG
jgi:hypothetical protein